MFESILCQVTEYDPDVLESLIGLAVEIAREGREGRRIGTLFTLGDEDAVLSRSRPLILDPLSGHPESSRHVTNLNLRGTIKELAQLDGGFVVSQSGVVLSACRYLDAVAAQVDVPLGLGSRHIAAANMSAVTKAVGIVVSESSVVRLFCHGHLVGEIIPEIWMIDHAQLRGSVKREQVGELTVLTPKLGRSPARSNPRPASRSPAEARNEPVGVFLKYPLQEHRQMVQNGRSDWRRKACPENRECWLELFSSFFPQ